MRAMVEGIRIDVRTFALRVFRRGRGTAEIDFEGGGGVGDDEVGGGLTGLG